MKSRFRFSLDKATRARILQLRNEYYLSHRAIAQRMGCTADIVRKVLQQAGQHGRVRLWTL